MPSVRGRLANGSWGALEVNGGVVRLKRETGFLNKTLKTLKEFPLSEATSTELVVNSLSYIRTEKLIVKYLGDEDDEEEVTILSEDGSSLEALKSEIDGEIERRELVRELEKTVLAQLMEAHVHQITLVLELIDQVFLLIFELDGDVDWSLMRAYMDEERQITREMGKIEVDPKLSYEIEDLGRAVRFRRVEDIKDECYGIIEAIHMDVEALIDSEHSGEFNFELYEWFVYSSTLLWDLKLGEFLGDPPGRRELEELQVYLRNLDGLVTAYGGGDGPEFIDELHEMNTIEPVFEKTRSLIHRSLNSLVEL